MTEKGLALATGFVPKVDNASEFAIQKKDAFQARRNGRRRCQIFGGKLPAPRYRDLSPCNPTRETRPGRFRNIVDTEQFQLVLLCSSEHGAWQGMFRIALQACHVLQSHLAGDITEAINRCNSRLTV